MPPDVVIRLSVFGEPEPEAENPMRQETNNEDCNEARNNFKLKAFHVVNLSTKFLLQAKYEPRMKTITIRAMCLRF